MRKVNNVGELIKALCETMEELDSGKITVEHSKAQALNASKLIKIMDSLQENCRQRGIVPDENNVEFIAGFEKKS